MYMCVSMTVGCGWRCLQQKRLDGSRHQQLRLLELHLHVDLLFLKVSHGLLILSGSDPFQQSEDDEGQEGNSNQGSSDEDHNPGVHTEVLREAVSADWRDKTPGGGRG